MSIRQKVLVVENEKEDSSYLSTLLSDNGYEVLPAYTGEEALSMITSHCPEVVLLELELPDMDGMKILSSVRKWTMLPIVVLSKRKDEQDIVMALDGGADDYMIKPYGSEELLARIRTAIRHGRTGNTDLQLASEGKIIVGNLTIDYDKYRVYLEKRDVGLTQNEFRMVALLGRYAGKVLTYERIMKELWGPNSFGDNQILRVNMTNIRKKLGEDPLKPKYIFTENGIGYRMVTREELEQS